MSHNITMDNNTTYVTAVEPPHRELLDVFPVIDETQSLENELKKRARTHQMGVAEMPHRELLDVFPVIDETKIEEGITPPRRGRPSVVKTMFQLKPGQCFVCPPGKPKRPHQTVYYYNSLEKKKGSGVSYGVSCRNSVYRIHRLS